MISSTLTGSILTALALAPLAVHAQQPEAVELDTIEVRALPQGGTALDATRPIDIITGEQLDDQKEATLGETLQAELGVQIGRAHV